MPRVQKSELLVTSLLAFLIIAIFGAICLRVASSGGPEWLIGQEFEVFLKLAGLTTVAAVAEICWRAISATSEGDRT